MIIAVITGPSLREAEMQIRASAPYAALFELRLDLIGDGDRRTLLRSAGKPVIATCRPSWERGTYQGSAEERLKVLEEAAELGADYVDLELALGPAFFRRFARQHPATRIIASRHLPAGERPDPEQEFKALRSTGAAVVKLAFDAGDACDNALAFQFLRLAAGKRQKAVAIAMGEAGEASRILYRKFGGWATYASPEGGAPAAPGQLPARMLSLLFRADRLKGTTRVLGVVGHPVRYSLGIFIHNPLLQQAAANAVYCRFPVLDLDAFMNSVAREMAAMSVTLPHKERMVRYVSAPDGPVLATGAVNTLLRRRGGWRGTNTDAAGALNAIEEIQRVEGKQMLVLGAGGAARAVVYEALRRGASVLVANRTYERARRLASDLGAEAVRLDAVRAVDILVNATSVGMTPHQDETPLPAGTIQAPVVFDVVYTPPETRFLREAREAGAQTISGLSMYVHQAAMQFKLYSGKEPDRKLLIELLGERSATHDPPSA